VLYRTALTIPAATSKYAPESIYLNVSEGIVTRWLVGFPPGCAGLVNVAVYWHEQKVLPEGEAASLYWDGYMYDVEDYLVLEQPPYRLRVAGWNNDTSYPHTVFVAATMSPIPEETELGMLQKLVRGLMGG
jgi:hypothetical protein